MRKRDSSIRKKRRLLKWFFVSFVGVILLWHVYSFVIALGYEPLELERTNIPSEYLEFRGSAHMHSTYSDGAQPPEKIIEAAIEEYLDFIVVTDHDNMGSQELATQRGNTRPLLIVGNEISTDSGHLLAYGLEKARDRFPSNAQEAIDEVLKEGGMPVIAHPFRKRNGWRDWNVKDWRGMELVNVNSMFTSYSRTKALFMLPQGFFNLKGAIGKIIVYPETNFTKWDEENRSRKVVGFVASDAHGPKYLGVPAYAPLISSVTIHVVSVSEKPALTQGYITKSLKHGNFYMAIETLAPSCYFDFRLTTEDNSIKGMGDVIEFKEGFSLSLNSSTPKGVVSRLIRDGRIVESYHGGKFVFPVDSAGVYRVEVWIPAEFNSYDEDKIWLVSNPIYVIEKEKIYNYFDGGAISQD